MPYAEMQQTTGMTPSMAPSMPVAPQPSQQPQQPQIPPSQPPQQGGFNLPTFIQNARQAGVPDSQTYQYLQQNGLTPPTNQPQTNQPQGPQLSDTGSLIGNVENSAGNFISSIGNAIAHPIDTITNLGKGIIGAGENLGSGLTTGNFSAAETKGPDQFTQVADKIGSYISQRYGSLDAAKKTAYQDPVGFLADASAVLSGVGGLGEAATDAGTDAAKVAQTAKAAGTDFIAGSEGVQTPQAIIDSQGPSAANRVFQGISKAGEATNPANVITKPIEAGVSWAKTGLTNLAPSLEETSLRLTPVQKVKYASKLADVSDYISKEIPLGNPESRFASASNNVNGLESQIQNFLTNDAGQRVVTKSDLLNQVEGLKSNFAGERDALSIDNQIDGFKKLLEAKYGDEIKVADLNKLKRSTYESAFSQDGTKVSNSVEYQIGDTLRQNIEDATKGLKINGQDIGDFNKDYGTAITAKKLLKVAMGRPQTDFVSRLTMDAAGGLVGSAFGGPIGAAVGTAAGNFISRELPTTAIRSATGRAASFIGSKIPSISVPANAINAASRISQASKSSQSQSKVPGKTVPKVRVVKK
jgi:hypothetical protein